MVKLFNNKKNLPEIRRTAATCHYSRLQSRTCGACGGPLTPTGHRQNFQPCPARPRPTSPSALRLTSSPSVCCFLRRTRHSPHHKHSGKDQTFQSSSISLFAGGFDGIRTKIRRHCPCAKYTQYRRHVDKREQLTDKKQQSTYAHTNWLPRALHRCSSCSV